jgi:hypothetical protein
MRPPRALPAAHFDRNERYAYFGDSTLDCGASDLLFRCASAALVDESIHIVENSFLKSSGIGPACGADSAGGA